MIRMVSRQRAGARVAALALILTILACDRARATDGPSPDETSAICERAASIAASESGVPLAVLRAISLTETGRTSKGTTRPWPWTVNMEGKGIWFDTPDQVLDYVRREFERGARSFDLGCFQINYRWHGKAFRSLDHMLEPVENARYAARFLTDLYREFGDWTRAAGAYHSRTPKFARRYEARFQRFLARLDVADPAFPPLPERAPEPVPTTTRGTASLYPFFRASDAPRGPGSLVPLPETPHAGRLIRAGG